MTLWNAIKEKINPGERILLVWTREHHVEVVPCIIDSTLRLVRDGAGRSWPKPDFDPKPFDKGTAYLALGEKIVPWPTREQPSYDVMDDETKIAITPEYLDQLTRDTDTEAWLRGVRGISLMDRLIHLGAGAAIGMVLTFLLLKLIGFVGTKTGGGSTTSVTITNATNATAPHAAVALMVGGAHVLGLIAGAWHP